MTTSEALIARASAACDIAESVDNRGTLVAVLREMTREYEIAVAQNIRMEAVIHNGVKALEELMAK